ncbi:hypothetical protein GUA87_00160 [Sneathiella sp. P13V-1]|uniref:hypothetical protein n=1 Tax=Sneathiella sp. P13V-1 TaxID=2697366 RepID=UPI00187B384C|nr:hypothetical protein [Sneathiella sp. P13V-1]MBE7635241.1 hypothetical protein [Sneathiella sp. P13V-1]
MSKTEGLVEIYERRCLEIGEQIDQMSNDLKALEKYKISADGAKKLEDAILNLAKHSDELREAIKVHREH